MAGAIARTMAASEIPVVDISALVDGSDPVGVAKKLYTANTGLGFVYVSGHGISAGTISRARESASAFFAATPELKQQVTVTSAHRGWLAPGGAKMNESKPADLKESFLFGADSVPDDADLHPLYGPNQWPEFVDDFRDSAMRFYVQASSVAQVLLRGFAIGLNLPPEFFIRSVAHPLSRASYVYYPPQTEDAGVDRFGVGPHTDFGVLTVLCQDDVGGLQVQSADGQWVHAPPVADTLVVNVADLLSRWTGGIYKSTPHRVVNTSGRERLSLVLAFDPDPHTLIDPVEVLGERYDGDEQAISCGDYLLWRFERAFAYRQ